MIPITQVTLYRPSMAALPDETGAVDANTMTVTATPQDAAEMLIGQMSEAEAMHVTKIASERIIKLESGIQTPANYFPPVAP